MSFSKVFNIKNSLLNVIQQSVKSRRGNKHLTAQRSNSNTVWFNFQMYIYTTSEKPVNDQSYGVLDRCGITILNKLKIRIETCHKHTYRQRHIHIYV
jgi:hypothetical protein